MSGNRRWLVVPGVCAILFVVLAAVLDRPILEEGPERPAPLSADDQGAITAALELYNAIYQDFHASGGNPALLDDFPATKAQRHYVFRDIGYLRNTGMTQVYDLVSFSVLEIAGLGPGLAQVDAQEEWNHVYQDAGTRAPVSEIKGLSIDIRYSLEKRDGSWIVVAWDPLPATEAPSP
jgi:hypothetical protein